MDQEKIGKLIAKLRKSKGLTQRELGDMVGVGFRAVSKWETGLTSPDISIINDLSKILGISADELLKGEIKAKESASKPKTKSKSMIYIIIIMSVILSIIIAITNTNKSYVYSIITPDPDYYIEGEVILKNNAISLKIDSIGFEDNAFEQIIIKNYQYEITCHDDTIFGYGYIPSTATLLPKPIKIEKWCQEFKLNYNGELAINNKYIIKNGLDMKITFIDQKNNVINKNIKMELKLQK